MSANHARRQPLACYGCRVTGYCGQSRQLANTAVQMPQPARWPVGERYEAIRWALREILCAIMTAAGGGQSARHQSPTMCKTDRCAVALGIMDSPGVDESVVDVDLTFSVVVVAVEGGRLTRVVTCQPV